MLILIIMCISLTIQSTCAQENATDLVEKITQFHNELIEMGAYEDLKTAAKITLSFGQLIPYLGTICTAASFIIDIPDVPEKKDPVLKKLEELSDVMHNVVYSQEQTIKLIPKVFAFYEFKQFIKTIDTLNSYHRTHLQNHRNETKQGLYKECLNENTFKFIDWMYNEIEIYPDIYPEFMFPLMKGLIDGFDRKVFVRGTQIIVQKYMQAMYLYGVCSRLKNESVEHLDDMHKKFYKQLEKMINTFKLYEESLKIHFWEEANKEIDHYLVNYKSLNHDEFAAFVHGKLREKYDWLFWIVASYAVDNDLNGYGGQTRENCNQPNCGLWADKHGRNLWVESTNNAHPHYRKTLPECLTEMVGKVKKTSAISVYELWLGPMNFPSELIHEFFTSCLSIDAKSIAIIRDKHTLGLSVSVQNAFPVLNQDNRFNLNHLAKIVPCNSDFPPYYPIESLFKKSPFKEICTEIKVYPGRSYTIIAVPKDLE